MCVNAIAGQTWDIFLRHSVYMLILNMSTSCSDPLQQHFIKQVAKNAITQNFFKISWDDSFSIPETQKYAHDRYEKILTTISVQLLVFPQEFPWPLDIQQFPVAQLQHPWQTNSPGQQHTAPTVHYICTICSDFICFLIFALVFVSRDLELGRNVSVDFRNFFSSDLHDSWYIGRGRWVMHDGMRYGRIEGHGQGHEPFKVWIPSIFNIYLLRHLQRQLANDH